MAVATAPRSGAETRLGLSIPTRGLDELGIPWRSRTVGSGPPGRHLVADVRPADGLDAADPYGVRPWPRRQPGRVRSSSGATIAWLLIEVARSSIALGYPGPVRAPRRHRRARAPRAPPPTSRSRSGSSASARGLPLVFITSGLVHALWHAIVVGLAVETVETGRASRWGAIRGLRALPVAFAIHAFGVAVLFTCRRSWRGSEVEVSRSDPPAARSWSSRVWVFAFAPVIAVTEARGFLECLGRAFRAARLPGSGNLTFAVIYVDPVVRDLRRDDRRSGPRIGTRREPPVHRLDLRARRESPPHRDDRGLRDPIPGDRRRGPRCARPRGAGTGRAGSRGVRTGPAAGSSHRRW